MTVTEAFEKISDMTKKNMAILDILNSAFYTKANHLSAEVGGQTYTIPSYIALENKVNHLQDAFDNLVHAARCGEAWFNFDGSSKELMVRGYQSAPSPIDLYQKNHFKTRTTNYFKDMLTPEPYLEFDVSDLPDDINKIRVRKVIPKTDSLAANFKTGDVATREMTWADMYYILHPQNADWKEGQDYILYDSDYELDVRKHVKSGAYVIESIPSDMIQMDEHCDYEHTKYAGLQERVTLIIHDDTPLKVTEYDGVGVSDLMPGDVLTTWDGSAKLRIDKIFTATRTIECVVVSGEYVHLSPAGTPSIPKGQNIFNVASDYSKLRLFSSSQEERVLRIPLEEDQHLFVCVAPINTRLNIQSEWGMGLCVDSYMLTKEIVTDGEKEIKYAEYYDDYVINMGDAIVEFCNIAFPPATKFSKTNWQLFKEAPKSITKDVKNETNCDTVKVFHINKHLNESETAKKIKQLYSQKKQQQSLLNELNIKIEDVNEKLSTISFDDISGTRRTYVTQLRDFTDQKKECVLQINKLSNEIATEANNSVIPIANSKYHIRGYIDVNPTIDYISNMAGSEIISKSELLKYISGIEYQYRYKNLDNPVALAQTVGKDNYLFSEWNIGQTPSRVRVMDYDGDYMVSYPDMNGNQFVITSNEIKFNQIDIPITQGEVVEIRARIVWGFGQPFAMVATEWSDLITVYFPEEFTKNIEIKTIIEENNNDIENNKIQNYLESQNIPDHIGDSITDQDVTFFHKPENISSGFYTEERRLIPLRDKLQSMQSELDLLLSYYNGDITNKFKYEFEICGVTTEIKPYSKNVVLLPSWNQLNKDNDSMSTVEIKGNDAIIYGNIIITNPTNSVGYLYPYSPGSRYTIANIGYEHTGGLETKYGILSHANDTTRIATNNMILSLGTEDRISSSTTNMWNILSNIKFHFINTNTSTNSSDPITGACVFGSDSPYINLSLSPNSSYSIPCRICITDFGINDVNKGTIFLNTRTSYHNGEQQFKVTFIANKTNTSNDLILAAARNSKYNIVIR